MKNLTKFLTVFLLALLGVSNLWAKKVYLYPGVWNQASAEFWVHPYDEGSDQKMTAVSGETGLFEATVGDDNKKYIITRNQSGSTGPWDNEWARITKEDGSGTTDNCFIITSSDLSSNNYKTCNLVQVIIYYATSESKTWKVNVARERNDNKAENWYNYTMSKTDKTYNGKSIYTATINTLYGGLAQLEFNDGNSVWDPKAFQNVWTDNSTFSGKIYAEVSSSWAWRDYNYDVTLTFNPQNGGANTTESVLKGGNITAPAAPSKTGYTFAGWGAGKVAAGGTISNVQADATYDAQWTPITYTIAYAGNDNTGGSTASSSHTYDVAKNLTTNGFTRAYTVTYDYDGATGGNGNASATATYTFDHWTCSANANTYTDGASVTNLTSTQGATVTMTAQWNSGSVTLPTPTKTGYTFSGWYNNSTKVGDGGASYTPTEAITLTAHWTAKQTTITLNGNGATTDGTPTQITATYGQQLPALESFTAPEKTGFNFKGYYSATTGGTQYYNNAGARVHNDNWANEAAAVTFYAQWENAATYSLTVNVNPSAAFTAHSENVEGITSLGQTYDISATLAEKGYTFTGWTAVPAENATFADASALSTTVTVNNGSVTVTANAVAKTTTLTLHSSKGTPTEQTITATYDQTFPQDQGYTKPTCSGYTFNGYFITAQSDPDGTKGTQIIKTDASGAFVSSYSGWIKSGGIWAKEDASKALYAHWTATSSNQIELNKNFTAGKTRSGEHGKAYITFDATAFDAGFTHATSSVGFTLLGYSTDAEGTNMVVNADGTFKTSIANYTDENGKWINPTFPTKLYAQWEEFLTIVTLSANPEGVANINVGGRTATSAEVGCKTTPAISVGAVIDNNAFTFNNWTLTNCSIIDDNGTKRLVGDGEHAEGSAVANFTLTSCKMRWSKTSSTFYDVDGEPEMSYDIDKKAYYIDITPTASPIYFRFKIGDAEWSADWDGSAPNIKTAVVNGSKLDCNQDVHAWETRATVKYAGCSSYPIRVWFDYNNKKTWITADAEQQWSIAGSDELGGWSTSQNVMTHVSESSVLWNVAVDLQANKEYEFKIVNRAAGEYYGCDYTIKSDYRTTTELSTSKSKNVKIQTTEAGSYSFQWSTGTKKVTVTYPAAVTYTITMANDGNGTTSPAESIELNEFSGTQISATPATGYHFDHWEGTTGIAFASTTSASTTATANQTGTITAHFAANTPIYFQNAIKNTWNPEHLYIYLYKDNTYWEGTGDDKQDRGTGSNKSMCSGSCIAGPLEMTHIQNTDIWEYDYDPALSFNTIVFTEQEMTNYEWFANCTAVRRTDFNSCMNMFVLNDATEEWHNNTARYFNNGFWRNYNSTTSKMSLHVWDVSTSAEIAGGNVEMVSDVPGNETFTAKVKLDGNHQYNIYLGACNSKNFSQNVTITSENCSGIQMYQYNSIDDKTQLAYLHTAASGDYTFSLTFADDKMLLSVEYPITSNDYRVKIGSPVRYSNIIRAAEASGTISMYLTAGTNTFTYEEATNVDVSPIEWGNEKQITVDNVEHAGVYTMTLTKGATPTITNVQPYTGNYYIRTDCAQGGWNEYKTNDNNLMRFTDRNPKYVNDSTTGFNYYYCRWNANASGNVRFVVANDINACISDTMKADAWLDDGEAMKGMANIRFGWNSNTNVLSRAYIAGSYDAETYLRILSEDSKLFEYPKADEGSYTEITAKKFKDENDWTYTLDVLADGGAKVAVSASYNDKYQSFVGEVISTTGEISKTEQLLEGGTKQHLHLVYDFKTDRLVSGWVPGGNIENTVILDADMLLARVGQGDADQINITTTGVQIQEIKTIYAVLQLDREKMLSNENGILAPNHLYENAIYWFSLPFDVKVNDIFGVDGYGTKWVLQYYDGAKRAKIGFFAETETFWTYLGINDTIKANVGYAVCLDPDYFDSAEDEIWANNRQSVCFYFPSTDKNLKIVGNKEITISVPAHECKIDREFGDADEKGNRKNHKDTDSDWNVIGSPAFQDMEGTAEMEINSLYKWNPTDNTYEVVEVKDFTFKSTSAYLVQFHGDIKWQSASVIINAAPRYTYADEKNYTVELQFYYGSQWDRTYIALKDNAQEDFVLNEDLTKMTNSGQPNIYSFAGAYDVAYNGTAFKDQIVNLGVSAPKNGTYTFSMPKDFSGTAQLYDMEEGTITDLNVANYSVDLNKGTYNNRFQLLLEVEAKVPTSIQADRLNGGEAEGKTQKLLRNGNIYLINDGRVYNATGAELR